MGMTITRTGLRFDSAHRVLGHQGKCRFLHGHGYSAEITVSAVSTNDLGMVIDFSVVKEKVGGWVDKFWDHNTILNPDDPLLHPNGCMTLEAHIDAWAGRSPYIMPDDHPNPTAENLAFVLFGVARNMLIPYGVHVRNVRIWETPNCHADYGES